MPMNCWIMTKDCNCGRLCIKEYSSCRQHWNCSQTYGWSKTVTLGGEITEPGGAMVGGSRQRMKTGFGGKIHGASEVEKLVGEVQRLSVMAETVSSALNQARTQQNEIRGKINSLAEDDRSIKLGTLKAEIDIASKN